MFEQRAAQATDGLYLVGALRRVRLVLGMLALLALLLPSLAMAQTSPPSMLCPSLNMSVAHGASQTLNVDSCHTGFGIGIVGTAPTHGSASTSNFPSTITYTHVGGGNVATSDFFSVSDEDGNWISVSVTIAAPTSAISIAPSTLPAMTAGTAFSQQLSASGGTAPYTYSISSGALPAGLSMTSAGLISGTPTQRGNANFTVGVVDGVSDTGSRGYSVSVTGGTLSISPNPPPDGVTGVVYSQSFTASGGVGPYTLAWEANPSNPLPPGLSLSGTTLSGTPTTVGNYTFGIRVTDSSTGTGTWFQVVNVTMAVTNPPTITVSPTTLPGATVGAAYSQTVTGGGGAAPYTFAVTAGALPAGLALASSTGVISGTPTAGGSFNFTVTATDANAFSGSRAYAFTVAAPIVIVAPSALPAATVGASYSQAITASGGTAPYTYAVIAGALPAGLTLASDGSLSGTATAGGSFNFTVTATDSSTGSGPYTGNRSYAFTVSAPTVTLAPATLPSASVGSAYNESITASGGIAPYSFAVTAGALPAGLTLASDGSLSGTATSGGSFNFTITATDSSTGSGPYAGSRAYAFTVAAPTVTLAPATLPSASVGGTYSETITASGGVAPYSFAVTAGALPAGLTLASDGSLSGTATSGGSFNFTITATDSSAGSGPYTGSRAYAFTVAAPTVTLAPATLPSASVGSAYSETITASGGIAPYSFAVTAGVLPAGLTLASDGSLSGTATSGGSFNFTITATDSSTGTGPYAGSQAYAFTVGAPTVSVAPASLPSGAVGTAYNQAITASGGTAPYLYAVTAGSLPAGLALAGDGTLSGTATASGTFNFTITATDSSTGSGPYAGSQAYAFTVAAPTVTLAPATLPSASVGSAYSETITASGGIAPYSYAVTAGSLPAGLTLTGDGTLIGTSTASGTFNFTITATDSSAGSGPYAGSQAYAFTVAAPTVSVAPATLPSATAGIAYSETITASGGIAPYSFAVTAGALPAGLTLAGNGLLSGTATAGGSFNFTVTATDSSAGSGPQAGSQTYAFTVAAPTVTVAPATLPSATAGTAYSEMITASGGIAPYSFAVTAGVLPAGLTLGSNGSLSGTATASGSFNFTVTATDSSAGSGPYTDSQAYAFTVEAPSVTVAPATLPSAKVGTAYSQTITADGGIAPYTFTVSSGALPVGLALSAAGELTGTPTAPGDFGFDVTATDSLGFAGSATYTLRAAQAAPVVVGDSAETVSGQALTIAVTDNDQGDIDSVAVSAAPGHGTAVVSGLAIIYSPATGFFGTDSFRYRAIGPGGTSGEATVTITVDAGAVPQGIPQSISTLAGQAVTLHAALSATGGPFTGMTVVNAPATGTVTVGGTDLQYTPSADAAGPVSIGYTLENAFGSSALITSTITVNPLPVPASAEVDTIAGVPVQVELTAGATGGPFISAEVVSISPASSGTATIASGGSGATATFGLTFTPATEFTGTAVVSFNLSNVFATSQAATVTVNVTPRPDPSRDAEVLGILNAQADASRRFAAAQIGNFQQRLRAMHDGGANAARFSNQLQFVIDRSCDEAAYRGTGRSCATAQPADEQAGISEQAPAATEASAFAIWTGGALGSGDRGRLNGSSSLSFETSGVSAGADYRANEAFAFGAGLGYGRDRTEVGENGSRSDADNRTAALYASWHPGDAFFLDGLLGYQWMSFDSQRHVAANGGTVQGERDGTQWFASISAGLDHHRGLLSISPYARLDHSRARLDGYAEHGDPVYALRYERQDVDATTGNLGLDADYRKPTNWGTFAPQLRIEYQHDFQGQGTATMHYADLLSGPVFQTDLNGFDRNRFMMGFGAAFYLQRGLTLRLEYRTLFGSDDEQSLLFNLEKKY